jgi:lysophospholipase L1-like esterase
MTSKRKRILLASVTIIVVALSLTVVFSQILASNSVNANLRRVACLGDSITNITGYPEDLQTLLGNTSVVGNFGVTASTVNWYGSKPYIFEERYRDARNFDPTAVVIMLGTNDARANLYEGIVNFTMYYERLINWTQRWNSSEKIFLVLPPPIFNNTIDLNGTFYAQEVVPRIQQVAQETGLPLIDVYTPLLNHSEYFPDGVHPNPQGAQAIADIIYKAIK